MLADELFFKKVFDTIRKHIEDFSISYEIIFRCNECFQYRKNIYELPTLLSDFCVLILSRKYDIYNVNNTYINWNIYKDPNYNELYTDLFDLFNYCDI